MTCDYTEHTGEDIHCLTSSQPRVPLGRFNSEFCRLQSGTQAIVTSYRFQCCGNVVRWGARVAPEGTYNFQFQVWRPVSENCYMQVGQTSLDVEEEEVRIQPSHPIPIQPGDVVGYFQYRIRNNDSDLERDPRGEGILLNTDHGGESVWHFGPVASLTEIVCVAERNARKLSIKPQLLNLFTNATPAITAEIRKYT